MKKLCIVGTGSQARYVIENLKNNKEYTIVGMVDLEKKENVGKKINNVEVICIFNDVEGCFGPHDTEVIVGHGNNLTKKELVKKLIEKRYKFATVISSDSYIASHVKIGKGCIINPNVTILPNTRIGDHVIIHSGCVIEHDNTIGSFVNMAPGVKTTGNVKIGEGTYLYTGAIVVPRVKIGKWTVVGAGAVVITDIGDNDFVVGVPAKSVIDKQNAE